MYFAPYIEPVKIEPVIGTIDYILIGASALMVIVLIIAMVRALGRRTSRKKRSKA